MRRPRWLGPYRLLYRIASGGMAEIYRGTRTMPDASLCPVALKCILPLYTSDPEFIEMLKDEARTCGLLDHPNIARIYELGNVEEQCFLAMEFVDGMDLRSIVRRGRERDTELLAPWALYVLEQALRGLHAAHERGIVHRDFSPSNILVGYEGEVKLIDFGIAKAAHNRSQTRSGVIKGKVKYMSPEQTMGKRLDARSDVFAAGVVLYEALTGNAPFHAPDDVSLMEAIRLQDPDPPSHHNPRLPAALDAVLQRALSKDVASRFPTAAAFADALAPLLREMAPGFEPSELGAFLCRIFARERRDAEEQLSEFDLDISPDDLTPTGERQSYTRLVAIGPFADAPAEVPPESLRDAVEEWLAARRAAQGTDAPAEAGAESVESTASTGQGDVWSSESRPGWVDETGRTLELEAIGGREIETGETERPDTGVFERENETTTRTHDD
jgi:serine/threonine-protein kinase